MKLNARQLYDQNLELIGQVNKALCRKRRLSEDECNDVSSHVHVRLLENGCAVLAKFRGKASLKSYLNITIENIYRDFRNHLWGKWRPTAQAQRLGDTAILLERLTHRDGYSFAEAVEIMRTNHRVAASIKELAELAARLPQRESRGFSGEEILDTLPAGEDPGETMLTKEKFARIQKIEQSLNKALESLDERDRLLIKMRFYRQIKVKEIAKRLDEDPRKLYKRFDRLLSRLEKILIQSGLNPSELEDF